MSLLKYIIPFLCLFACNEKETIDNTEPSDLTISIEIATDGSGNVSVQANAINTIEYHFYMGDGNADEPYKNNDGLYNHTYEKLGTYEVEVRAYGSSGRYIRKTKQITVLTGDPSNTGEGYTTPTSYDGMQLVWTDEFEGTSLNTANWSYDIGTGCPDLCGWGNNELEYYRAENSSVSNGVLTIEARKEAFQGSEYTSAKIVSRGKQSFKYGRIDIRAVLPKGQGIWPALWMLGINHNTIGWPKCGEIDMMEMIGGNNREDTVYGNVFWDDNGVTDERGDHSINTGTFADEFHVFSIIWEETQIRWFVNDQLFHSFDITGATKTAFQEEFYLIMNVAVGGNWPGNPDNTTVFPQQMLVDYIRVFQKE